MLPPEIWIIILSFVPEMLDVVKCVSHQIRDLANHLQKGKVASKGEDGVLHLPPFSYMFSDEYYKRSCSFNAAKNGHLSLVQWIIEKSRLNPCKYEPLPNIFKGAVEGGQKVILEWLLDNSYLVWLRDNQYELGTAAKDIETLQWIHDNLYARYCIRSYELFLRSLTKFSREGDISAIKTTLCYIPSKKNRSLEKALWKGILESGNMDSFQFYKTMIGGFESKHVIDVAECGHLEMLKIMLHDEISDIDISVILSSASINGHQMS